MLNKDLLKLARARVKAASGENRPLPPGRAPAPRFNPRFAQPTPTPAAPAPVPAAPATPAGAAPRASVNLPATQAAPVSAVRGGAGPNAAAAKPEGLSPYIVPNLGLGDPSRAGALKP